MGAFYLPLHQFSTEDGFVIEFEYVMKGAVTAELTDGICMFLVDAAKSENLQFGAEGAGFGYTHRLATSTTNRRLGIKGGYLAVALDQGPFKTLRMVDQSDGDEMRNGVIYHSDPNYSTSAQPRNYDTRSNVTIRGAAGNELKQIPVPGRTYRAPEAMWGYPVLVTRHTGWGRYGATGLENTVGLRKNSQGYFEQYTGTAISSPFDLAGQADFTHSDEAAYRKATIILEPNPNITEGGFKVSVIVQHGSTPVTVIKDFTYPATIKYIENGYPRELTSGLAQVLTTPPIIEYTVARPVKLVVGFAASTGWNTPYVNKIKNLRITPVYAANSANDDVFDHRRGPVTVRPLDNDLGFYKDNTGVVTWGKDFIDPDSFRFWTDEYTCLDDARTYTAEGKGKWVYDPATMQVLFFPNKGFTGTVTMMYDINGLYYPFNEDKYRSSLATISVSIADNQPLP